MHIAKALNTMRPPSAQVKQAKPEDFNRPRIRFSGKTYEPSHPMYETIRRLIMERYKR